jgi:hypothetical protein
MSPYSVAALRRGMRGGRNKAKCRTYLGLALRGLDFSQPALKPVPTTCYSPLGFARLRRDDPVHFCDGPLYAPYWSVTRYRDIMTVDTSHQTYSSDAAFGGITLKDVPRSTSWKVWPPDRRPDDLERLGSKLTPRRREPDSNHRSRRRGTAVPTTDVCFRANGSNRRNPREGPRVRIPFPPPESHVRT